MNILGCNLLAGCALAASALPAAAQLQVDVILRRTKFLAYESVPVWVQVTNNTPRPITLENTETTPWVVMDVTNAQGHPIHERRGSPRYDPITIAPGQTIGRTVDIAPQFFIQTPGHYRVVAVVYYKGEKFYSNRPEITVEKGRVVWEKKIAIEMAPPETVEGSEPRPPRDELRTYQLLRYNVNDGQRLYLKILGEGEVVYACYPLGPILMQIPPEVILEPSGALYVLQEWAPQNFLFSAIAPDGERLMREQYTAVRSRPALARGPDGGVGVSGGERVAE